MRCHGATNLSPEFDPRRRAQMTPFAVRLSHVRQPLKFGLNTRVVTSARSLVVNDLLWPGAGLPRYSVTCNSLTSIPSRKYRKWKPEYDHISDSNRQLTCWLAIGESDHVSSDIR